MSGPGPCVVVILIVNALHFWLRPAINPKLLKRSEQVWLRVLPERLGRETAGSFLRGKPRNAVTFVVRSQHG